MLSEHSILVALADPKGQRAFESALARSGVRPVFASSVGETRRILERERIELVICEDHLNDGDFHDVLTASRSGPAGRVPVVVTSHLDDTSEYLEAMKLGAFDFISAPYERHEIERIVDHALHRMPPVTVP